MKKGIYGQWDTITWPRLSREAGNPPNFWGLPITGHSKKNMENELSRNIRDAHIENWLVWWLEKCLEQENCRYAGATIPHLSGRLQRHRETMRCGFDHKYEGMYTDYLSEYTCSVPEAEERLRTRRPHSTDLAREVEYSLPLLLSLRWTISQGSLF